MFRNMRRHKQQLDRDKCIEILTTNPRGVLAVLGDEGYPYTVPMNFVYEDGKIYFHSAVNGHKIDAVRRYDKASFCVIDQNRVPDGEGFYYIDSVTAFGRVKIVEDEAVKNDKLRQLGLKYFPTAEMVESDIQKNAARALVLELTVEHLTGKHVHER